MKNIFKSLLSILLIAGICTGLSACSTNKNHKTLLQTVKERGKIIVGVKYDSKPFGFMDQDQQLKGYDIDMVREVAKRLFGSDKAIEFQQVTSSNRIFSLTSGTVDMVAATMTINPKRKQVIDFSIPYYVAGQAIMLPKDSPVKSLRDLKGKKVIVVLGSTSEKNIREIMPDANVQGFRTYTDAFSALRSGRGEALTTDDTIIAGFLTEDSNFKMLPERYTREPYGIGFRKGEDTESFQQAINTILDEMHADGTFKQIDHKWMSVTKAR